MQATQQIMKGTGDKSATTPTERHLSAQRATGISSQQHSKALMYSARSAPVHRCEVRFDQKIEVSWELKANAPDVGALVSAQPRCVESGEAASADPSTVGRTGELLTRTISSCKVKQGDLQCQGQLTKAGKENKANNASFLFEQNSS
jgi:hypothetical protein